MIDWRVASTTNAKGDKAVWRRGTIDRALPEADREENLPLAETAETPFGARCLNAGTGWRRWA